MQQYILPHVVCLKGKKDGTIVQGCDVYIGRRMTMSIWNLDASVWANPFPCKTEQERAQCLINYEAYLRQEIVNNQALWGPRLYQLITTGRSLSLGCWCKKAEKIKKGIDVPCHGDIIVKILKEYIIILTAQQNVNKQ